MSSTDALWDELSRETRRQDDRVARLLRRSMATSSTAEKVTKPKPKLVDPWQTSSTSQFDASGTVGSQFNAPASRKNADSSSNIVASGFNLQREINRLSSELQSERKQAALALEAHFLTPRQRGQCTCHEHRGRGR